MSESLELVCPHCQAINRVPTARLHDGPSCGRCGGAILPSEPVSVDGAGLQRLLTRDGLPVLVDFWAPWCGPCRAFAPTFQQAAATYAGLVRFAKLDTEAHPDAGARHQIRSIPTLALFKGGRELDRVSGALPAPQLRAWLARHGL
ncbi:thioredoxin TrxC [Aquabacterium sp. A3]|uniref:thioredoxin TrxC n=1 Tax=Aquabacterium sp. A3 TaxID=3132829 RepID=UPI00311A2D2B